MPAQFLLPYTMNPTLPYFISNGVLQALFGGAGLLQILSDLWVSSQASHFVLSLTTAKKGWGQFDGFFWFYSPYGVCLHITQCTSGTYSSQVPWHTVLDPTTPKKVSVMDRCHNQTF